MIDRTTSRSKVSLPVLESTQRHLRSLARIPAMAKEFTMLGDPTRLLILLSLSYTHDLCVSDLADILEMDTSAISHQLRKLKDSGLVTSHREGSMVYYRLETGVIREMLAMARALLLDKQSSRGG